LKILPKICTLFYFIKTSSFLKKEAKKRRPSKTPNILSSPPAWIRKIFHIFGTPRFHFIHPRLTGINRKMPQLGILPKLIFRGNFASFDFLSQSLISFAQIFSYWWEERANDEIKRRSGANFDFFPSLCFATLH